MNDNAKYELTPQAEALLKLLTAQCAAALNWDYRFSALTHARITGLLALATKALREQSDDKKELISLAGLQEEEIFDEWEWHESSTAFFGVAVSVHDMHTDHDWLTRALAEEEKRYDEYKTKNLVGPRFVASIHRICTKLAKVCNAHEAEWISSQPQENQKEMIFAATSGGHRETYMGELGELFYFISGGREVSSRHPVNEYPGADFGSD